MRDATPVKITKMRTASVGGLELAFSSSVAGISLSLMSVFEIAPPTIRQVPINT
jgi:hypothetical protein